MKVSKYLTHVIRDFFAICTCATIATAAFLTFFSVETVHPSLLWQILAVSFVAALLDFVYYNKAELSKKALILRGILHYILINVLLFSSARIFGWFTLNDVTLAAAFAFSILAVYVAVFTLIYMYDKAQAKQLNKKLSEYKNRRGEGLE